MNNYRIKKGKIFVGAANLGAGPTN
jgi:hypothetical protein